MWDLLIQSAHPHFSETRVRPGWCQCTCLPAVKPTSDGHQACKEETDQSCCGQDVKGNLPMGSSVLVAVGPDITDNANSDVCRSWAGGIKYVKKLGFGQRGANGRGCLDLRVCVSPKVFLKIHFQCFVEQTKPLCGATVKSTQCLFQNIPYTWPSSQCLHACGDMNSSHVIGAWHPFWETLLYIKPHLL